MPYKESSLNRLSSRRKTQANQMVSFAHLHNPITIINLAVVTTSIFKTEIIQFRLFNVVCEM